MIAFSNLRALLGLHATALLALAACGGSVATPSPQHHRSSGGEAGTEVPETTGGEPEPMVGVAGETATTNSSGSAGDSGTTPASCIAGRSIGCACSSGDSGAQVCLADGTYGSCVCSGDSATWEQKQLGRLREGIVGTWTGKQTNPWNSGCPTTITFEANGHYSAHSSGEDCIVFYYGSNEDSVDKTYLLNDVLPTAEGQGEIVFWFGRGDTNLGQVRHLELSADENALKFEAWKDQYGPLVFTLKRVAP